MSNETSQPGYQASSLSEDQSLGDIFKASPISSEGLSGTSLDQSEFEKSLGIVIPDEKVSLTDMERSIQDVKSFKPGDIIHGKVSAIAKEGVLVDIDAKTEGIIPFEELTSLPNQKADTIVKEGEMVDVMLLKLENKEGRPLLSKKLADYEKAWGLLYQAEKKKESVQVFVIQAIAGGLVVDFYGIRGFIPMSHVGKDLQSDPTILENSSVFARPLEVERKRRKVVLSHKLAGHENKTEINKDLFKNIEVGQIKHGKVTSIKSFGAFVDLGGVEGLVHISELSWSRVAKVEDVLQAGQEVDVFVIGVDEDSGRISLGIRQLSRDPWANVEEKYKQGQAVRGKIVRIAQFGAFAELEPGLEGLIHVSELSDTPVKNVEEILKVGDELDMHVLRVSQVEQKIGLTLRNYEAVSEAPAVEVKPVAVSE